VKADLTSRTILGHLPFCIIKSGVYLRDLKVFSQALNQGNIS
jgi:hypothetical protein